MEELIKDFVRLFFPDTEEEERGEVEREWKESYRAVGVIIFIVVLYGYCEIIK